MNANLIRSILAFVSLALGAISTLFGCDALATTCSASWLDPKYLAIVMMVLGAGHLILKIGQGFVGLVNPTAPIVDASVAGPGTVTAAQVAAPSIATDAKI